MRRKLSDEIETEFEENVLYIYNVDSSEKKKLYNYLKEIGIDKRQIAICELKNSECEK